MPEQMDEWITEAEEKPDSEYAMQPTISDCVGGIVETAIVVAKSCDHPGFLAADVLASMPFDALSGGNEDFCSPELQELLNSEAGQKYFKVISERREQIDISKKVVAKIYGGAAHLMS